MQSGFAFTENSIFLTYPTQTKPFQASATRLRAGESKRCHRQPMENIKEQAGILLISYKPRKVIAGIRMELLRTHFRQMRIRSLFLEDNTSIYRAL